MAKAKTSQAAKPRKPRAAAGAPAKPPGGLTPLEMQAVRMLAKGADDFREFVRPGLKQPVDVLLRIEGTLDVADDQPSSTTRWPKTHALVGNILDLVGPKTQDKIAEALIACGAELAQVSPRSRRLAVEIVEALIETTPITKAGNVGGQLIITRCPDGKA